MGDLKELVGDLMELVGDLMELVGDLMELVDDLMEMVGNLILCMVVEYLELELTAALINSFFSIVASLLATAVISISLGF